MRGGGPGRLSRRRHVEAANSLRRGWKSETTERGREWAQDGKKHRKTCLLDLITNEPLVGLRGVRRGSWVPWLRIK